MIFLTNSEKPSEEEDIVLLRIGSAPSLIDPVYADARWVKGVTAGYIMGPDKMQDRKGHCPMMVTVDVQVGEPGDEEEDKQGSEEEGVNLLLLVRWPEERDERWQQWGKQVHVKMRRGSHVHQAMRRAAREGFIVSSALCF